MLIFNYLSSRRRVVGGLTSDENTERGGRRLEAI